MLYPDFQELVRLGQKAMQPPGLDGRPVTSATAGDYASPFRGAGLEFEEVRHYMPGDDVRNIDWRVTARTGTPHLKIFTQERERTMLLCIDASAALKFGTRGTFKSVQAARAAALLGWYANGNNDRVGAVVYGDVPDGLQFFRPSRSRRSLWKTLKLLSEKSPAANGPPVSMAEGLTALDTIAPTGALIFIIAGFETVPANLEKRLARLHRRCDVVLVRINDPADDTIPPIGTLNFVGADGSRLRINTGSRTGREAYTKQWRDNRSVLRDICLRRQISIIDLHTGSDVYADLVSGLRHLHLKRERK